MNEIANLASSRWLKPDPKCFFSSGRSTLARNNGEPKPLKREVILRLIAFSKKALN